uniref:Uncharacterized protein n=1 Tax=Rhizophora mucronata TaxID=61149 RepID=A0A2P2N457_RHIMU
MNLSFCVSTPSELICNHTFSGHLHGFYVLVDSAIMPFHCSKRVIKFSLM